MIELLYKGAIFKINLEQRAKFYLKKFSSFKTRF